MKNLNVLLVDDHPLILVAYKNVIPLCFPKKYQYTFFEAVDCETAYNMVTDNDVQFDLAFLDLQMPPFLERNINSGEDIAKLLKEKMPKCKILILTMFPENFRLLTIAKEINPIGLIIKNDLDFDEVKLILEYVLQDKRYYSKKVINYFNSIQKERVYVDVINTDILLNLQKGIEPDNVAIYIFSVSSSQVLQRIEFMKELLGKPDISNQELVEIAKTNGMMNYKMH